MAIILFWLIVGWAFRSAWLHVNGQLRESRSARVGERERQLAPKKMTPVQRKATAARHDTGWWLREVFSGFPVTLHGWQSGWLAHNAAAEQHRAIRDEHRGVRDSFRAARKQGQENLQAIDAPGSEPLTREQMKERLRTASPAAQPRAPEAVMTARPAAPPEPAAAGAPSPVAAVPPPDPEPVPAPSPVTQGDPMPNATSPTAETTYSQDLDKARKIIINCDIEGTRLRMQQAVAWVEQMVAAGLDAKHAGMAADLADRIEEQIKANRQVHDAAEAFKNSLQRTHQAGNEYHSSTVDGGASREYLRD